MKKGNKMVLCAAMFAVLGGVITSFADEWKADARGWYYDKGGTSAASEWIADDGKWYYVGADGYMLSDAWVGNYYVGSDGAMLVNATTPDGYQVGADGAWMQETAVQDTGYLEAYAQVLRELLQKNPPNYQHGYNLHRFQLIYVDGDSIPELLISTGASKTYPLLYTYYQGAAKLLDEFPCDSWDFYYVEQGNLMYAGLWYNGDRTDDIFYTINQGELSLVARFYADHFREQDYAINKQPVPRATYEAQLNAMKNSYLFKKVNRETNHEVTEENIQKMLADISSAM